MARRMSEKERMYFFVILFPILWPLGIAMLISDGAMAIDNAIRSLWQRMRRS